MCALGIVAFLFIFVVAALLVIPIMSAISAVFLKVAAMWVQKIDVPFSNCFTTMVLSGIVTFILSLIVSVMTGMDGQSSPAASFTPLLMWPVGFAIQSGFVSNRIQVSFGKACLISATMTGMMLAIVAILVVSTVLLFKVLG